MSLLDRIGESVVIITLTSACKLPQRLTVHEKTDCIYHDQTIIYMLTMLPYVVSNHSNVARTIDECGRTSMRGMVKTGVVKL